MDSVALCREVEMQPTGDGTNGVGQIASRPKMIYEGSIEHK